MGETANGGAESSYSVPPSLTASELPGDAGGGKGFPGEDYS